MRLPGWRSVNPEPESNDFSANYPQGGDVLSECFVFCFAGLSPVVCFLSSFRAFLALFQFKCNVRRWSDTPWINSGHFQSCSSGQSLWDMISIQCSCSLNAKWPNQMHKAKWPTCWQFLLFCTFCMWIIFHRFTELQWNVVEYTFFHYKLWK